MYPCKNSLAQKLLKAVQRWDGILPFKYVSARELFLLCASQDIHALFTVQNMNFIIIKISLI